MRNPAQNAEHSREQPAQEQQAVTLFAQQYINSLDQHLKVRRYFSEAKTVRAVFRHQVSDPLGKKPFTARSLYLQGRVPRVTSAKPEGLRE